MLINEQREARRGWSRWGAATYSAPDAPSVALFRPLAQRNPSRSRRRYLRARPSHLVAGNDLWKDGRHRVEIPEDEVIPVARPGAFLDLPDHFSPPLTSMDPRLTVQSVKRPGDPLDTRCNKEKRAEKDTDASDLDMGAMDITASCGVNAPHL